MADFSNFRHIASGLKLTEIGSFLFLTNIYMFALLAQFWKYGGTMRISMMRNYPHRSTQAKIGGPNIQDVERQGEASRSVSKIASAQPDGTEARASRTFTAVFRNPRDTPECIHVERLAATTIQAAIDEAKAAAGPDFHGADALDIFDGDDKVETVGLGVDACRT